MKTEQEYAFTAQINGNTNQLKKMPKKYKENGISRQRRWQLKKEALGLCAICGKEEEFRGGRCLSCNIKLRGKDYKPRAKQEAWKTVDWTLTNREIAEQIGSTIAAVYQQRRKRNK